MSIYPKTIGSVKALRKEQGKLRKQALKLEEEAFGVLDNLSLDAILPDVSKSKDTGKASFNPSSVFSFLPGLGRIVPDFIRDKAGNLVKNAAIEFLGGYLKWKAIELSVKGIRRYFSRKASLNREKE